MFTRISILHLRLWPYNIYSITYTICIICIGRICSRAAFLHAGLGAYKYHTVRVALYCI